MINKNTWKNQVKKESKKKKKEAWEVSNPRTYRSNNGHALLEVRLRHNHILMMGIWG